MRIALDYFPEPLAFENQTAVVLALENKTVFRRVVNAFLEDCADEVLTFSQEWKPFAFSKQGLYIANLLQPDADTKKLMNHVASAMEQTLNTDLAEPLALVRQDLLQLGDALTARFDYDVVYQDDLEAAEAFAVPFAAGRKYSSRAPGAIFDFNFPVFEGAHFCYIQFVFIF